MSTIFAERPSFFEGQYLGADDLEAFLKYAREYDARHLLGAHTWGIVAGIELTEGTSPTGEVEYFLTPGLAVDGYGRLIVVTAPFALTSDLFAQQPSGSVDVWIRYDESPFSGARTGFLSCECSDAFARVAEAFVVEVGRRATTDQRESGVLVGDETFVDAREALGTQLSGQPLACDGSVAAQTFPDADTRSLWLIPVAQVPWDRPKNAFRSATEADRKASRSFRREAGLVAGHIYPAGGVIRLRPRWSPRQMGVSADQICAMNAIQETDLITCASGELSFRELIWLEGHSRFKGDARLYGSRLEFQEAQGTDYLANGVPLVLRRRPERNELEGFDLQLLLGARQGADGPTRFTIGKATVQGNDPCALDFQFEPGVCIQEDGKLGIGTLNSLLSLPLTLRAIDDTGNLAGFEAADGSLAWQMNFGASKNGLNFTETDPAETRLFLRTGGDIGIGTLTPEAKLDIRGVPVPQGNPLGARKWFQVGDGGDSGRMWLQYGDQLAPLLVLSDQDNPPRIQFQQIGGGPETAPEFSSWIGLARSGSADLALMGGLVGVGTATPTEQLEVRGNIKLGASGDFFGLGCLDNLRMVAGRVDGNGNILSGSGFTVQHITVGQYRLTYSNSFVGIPIVVATLVNSTNLDNFLTVTNSLPTGFDIFSRDHNADADAIPQDSAFNFIALGLRG